MSYGDYPGRIPLLPKQCSNRHFKGFRDLIDVVQPYTLLRPLDCADVSSMKTGGIGKVVLRPSAFGSKYLDII